MIEFLDLIKNFEIIFIFIVGLFLVYLTFFIIKVTVETNTEFLGIIGLIFMWLVCLFCLYYLSYVNEESKEYCKFFPQTEICQELNKDGLYDKRFKMLSYKQMFEMLEKVEEQKQIENYEHERSKIKNIKIN